MKDCQYYIELISAELDGEATQEQRSELAAHLEGCAYCRGIYEMLHGCTALLDETVAEPPESLCENVMGEIRRAELRKKRGRRSIIALAACAAIVIIGGVSIMGTWRAGRSDAAVYSMERAVSESAVEEVCEIAAAPAAACAPEPESEEDFDAGSRSYEYELSEESVPQERAAGAYMQNYSDDLARQCTEIYLADDEILAYISEKETSLPETATLYAKMYIPQNNEYLSVLLYLDGEEAYCENANKICKIVGLNASDIFYFVEMHSFSQ